MKPSPDMSVMEYAVRRAGVLKGSRVCSFVTQWTLATQAIGRPITIEEYREWWHINERTAWRHQAEFREVFAPMLTPEPIAAQAIARAEALQHGVKGVGQLPLGTLRLGT